MGSISGFGIGCAVLTVAWATSLAAATQEIPLRVEIDRLRNEKGVVHACLTRDQTHFPDCKGDPRALRVTVPASEASVINFRLSTLGDYALSVIHDENENGKLDTFAKIPREGFGFSRNPPIGFGPPKFGHVSFALAPGANLQAVRIRYLL